jgi:hypothetical protein
VQIVRLHVPGRRPASWTEIIQRGQFAVFAKDAATGVPCDHEGARFADPAAGTCAIFDSVAEARTFCEAAVHRHPDLQFDIFDSGGRTQPPVLTVTHPERAGALETSPRQMRRRRVLGWTLVVAGVPLLLFAYAEDRQRDTILAAFMGINAIIVGARLLWMNVALRETERAREERLAQASGSGRRDT